MDSMIKQKEVDYDLDMQMFRLLQDEPFFALLSRQLNKTVNYNIKTAGIRFNKEDACYEIEYNPVFMAGQIPNLPLDGDKHEKWVLMHELYHASLGHCTFRKQDEVNHKIQNKGMDCAINSLRNMQPNAPSWVLMPGRDEFEFMGERYEECAEWYIKQIKKDEEENPGKHTGDGDGDGQFDSHEGMTGEESGHCPERDIADRRLSDAVAKAAQEADVGDGESQPKGWGSVSREVRKKIRSFANSRKAKLDPKKVLASFVKASVDAEKRTSVTKRNRRLPGLKFGNVTDQRAHVAISIDQSGSVSDELLEKVFGWLSEFAQFASFTVIPFDHRVFEKKVYEWKQGEKRNNERVLCGGTDFDAPTDYVNKRGFDGHIVVTDMYAPKPKRSNCQRMWITDKCGANHREAAGRETLMVLD